jgi:hypothetical protein
LTFFIDFGAFNRAGKSVSKIGIYALPPSKSEIYGIFIEIGSRIYSHHLFLCFFGPWHNVVLFHLLVFNELVTLSFSGGRAIVSGFLFALDFVLFGVDTIALLWNRRPSKKEKGPVYRRKRRRRQ